MAMYIYSPTFFFFLLLLRAEKSYSKDVENFTHLFPLLRAYPRNTGQMRAPVLERHFSIFILRTND